MPRLGVATMCLGIAVASGAAHAKVLYYGAYKSALYVQNSPSAPSAANSWRFSAQLQTDRFNDLNQAVVDVPGPTPSLNLQRQTPFLWVGSSPSFATKEDLDAAYPGAQYDFTISGGDLLTRTASVDNAVEYYADAVPALTGPAFSSLHLMDPAFLWTGSINTWNPDQGVEFARTFISLRRRGSTEVIYQHEMQPGQSQFTVPAGLMSRATTYEMFITFTSRNQEINAGFISAVSESSFDVMTRVRFVTIPGPAAAAPLLVCGGLALVRRSRR